MAALTSYQLPRQNDWEGMIPACEHGRRATRRIGRPSNETAFEKEGDQATDLSAARSKTPRVAAWIWGSAGKESNRWDWSRNRLRQYGGIAKLILRFSRVPGGWLFRLLDSQ